mmetsp:Transcript_117968/g.366784  ORF Transcript_117968/g.366784 Transcript_117968/m.366784 type:complete len:208 (-) Transcript_117968:134-757(-)
MGAGAAGVVVGGAAGVVAITVGGCCCMLLVSGQSTKVSRGISKPDRSTAVSSTCSTVSRSKIRNFVVILPSWSGEAIEQSCTIRLYSSADSDLITTPVETSKSVSDFAAMVTGDGSDATPIRSAGSVTCLSREKMRAFRFSTVPSIGHPLGFETWTPTLTVKVTLLAETAMFESRAFFTSTAGSSKLAATTPMATASTTTTQQQEAQ